MAKNRLNDYDTSAAGNTDIAGISILGTAAVSNFDGAVREYMSQIADWIAGTPVNDTANFCDPADNTKIFRIDAGSITTGTTRVYTAPNASGTLSLLGLAQSWTASQDFQGGANVIDSTFTISDNGDQTKKLAFSIGAITTATTRTITVPDASGTLAFLGLAQTWTAAQDFTTGANFADSTLTISDNGDATKKIAFQASGITTGTTRTFTAPNSNGTWALVDVAQTWSGGVQDFQAGANVIDSSFTIKDNGDQTRVAAFSAGGITAGNTRTLTIPDASGTLALVSSGTFTPVVAGTTAAGAGTYTTQEGSYTRIGTGGAGDIVHFKIKLVWTAHTGTGNIRITGLPVTGGTPLNDVFTIFAENLTYSNTLACTFGTASTLALQTISTGAAAGNVAMDTAATLLISGSYIAA